LYKAAFLNYQIVMRIIRNLFSISYLLIISSFLNAQTKIDSTLMHLEIQLTTAKTDSLKVEALLKLCSYQRKRDYNKVITYCSQIHEILDSTTYNTNIQKAKTLGHSGIYKRRKSDYVGALKDYYAAEKIYIRLNDTVQLSTIYHNIGFVYRAKKDYHKAIKQFNKAITLNNINKKYRNLGNNYSMMSQCYKNLHQTDSAFYVINKAIEYFELDNYEEGKQQAIANKASVLTFQKKYNQALSIYLDYLEYVKSIHKKRSIVNTLINIANSYLQIEEYSNALRYVNEGIEMAISQDTKQYLYNGYLIRSRIYKAMKKYDFAFKDVAKYTEINEEINNVKKAKELQDIEVLHAYEKKRLKDSIIRAAEKKNILIHTKTQQLKKQLYISILFIFTLLIIIILLFRFKRYKKANKSHIKKEKQLSTTDHSVYSEVDIKKKQVSELHTKTVSHRQTKEASVISNPNNTVLLEQIISNLKNDIVDDEKINVLKENIKASNRDFLIQLKIKHPKLTKTDIEVCSFIKVGFSRNEIASVRKTTLEAIKSTRFRLKKKLQLGKEDKLDEYIQNL